MISITAYAKIEDGKLVLHSRKRFDQDLKDCKNCEVIVTVKKRGTKSQAQLGYLFGCCYKECQLRFFDLGHRLTIDEIHTFFKSKFLSIPLCDKDGTVIAEFPGSIADMNKDQLCEFTDRVREYASTVMDLVILDPNSDNSMSF